MQWLFIKTPSKYDVLNFKYHIYNNKIIKTFYQKLKYKLDNYIKFGSKMTDLKGLLKKTVMFDFLKNVMNQCSNQMEIECYCLNKGFRILKKYILQIKNVVVPLSYLKNPLKKVKRNTCTDQK